MKKISTLLLFISFVFPAKNSAQSPKLDSMIKVITEIHGSADSAKAIIALAEEIALAENYRLATDWAEVSLRISRQFNLSHIIARSLIITGRLKRELGNYAEAEKEYEEALEILEGLKDTRRILTCYKMLGILRHEQGDFSSAIKKSKQAIDLAEALRDTLQMALCCNNIGASYSDKGDPAMALEYNLKAVRLFEAGHYDKYLVAGYSNLGTIFQLQGNLEEALKYYNLNLKYQLQGNDPSSIAFCYVNIGGVYAEMKKTSEALKYFLSAIDLFEEGQQGRVLIECYRDVAEVYSAQGNYNEAMKYYHKSLSMCEKTGDQHAVAMNYAGLGAAELKRGNPLKAVEWLKKGLDITRRLNQTAIMNEIYRSLFDSYYFLRDIDSTYLYFHFYSATRDSILNEATSKQFAEMQTKYETEKKDKEITVLNLENEKKQTELVLSDKQRKIAVLNFQNEQQQRELVTSENDRNMQSLLLSDNLRKQQQDSIINLSAQKALMMQRAANERTKRKYAIAGGTGITLLLSLVFYQFYRRRQTKNKLEVNQLQNKVLRTQLNPHFIFNALNSIRSYITQHPDLADSYLTKFSMLMRQVLENSVEEKISLQEEIAMLENYMQLETLRIRYGFDYEISIAPSIDAANTMVPPLILQPMIENAIWHGLNLLPHRGKITLLFTEKNGLLEAVVEDNGIGIGSTTLQTKSTEKKSSLGFQITRQRIELLNRKSKSKGSLVQQVFEKGSQVRMEIPVG